MFDNLTSYPYASGRRVVMGKRHAAATSQPLATLAGMEMFWAGGNAVDAALAMAIALTVVEPTSNGIGSDAFAIVWEGKPHGLNASGKSSQSLQVSDYAGLATMPQFGWRSVTVPGAVSAWRSLWERWGKLPFEQLFAPAIRYAEEGFPVSPETARAWQTAEALFVPLNAPEFQSFKQVFFEGDRAPRAGEIWASPAHGATLREIASTGGESFYRGELANRMAAFADETGGILTATDLADHQPLWVEPISTDYRDLTLWEIPPNGQGIAALLALNILEGFDLSRYPRDSVESFHLQIESMKLAFADVHSHVSDADWLRVSAAELLDKSYAAQRRKRVSDRATIAYPHIRQGGTVYLATADQDLMVSFIQSNYEGFGSGILIPDTGIALHNRGMGFSLEPDHANCLAPNKRPFHTIIPGFLSQGDRPLGPLGVMGAHMQPQGHLQMMVNLRDYGMNPQAALDAPRWCYTTGRSVLLEQSVPRSLALGLSDRDHAVQVMAEARPFGKGQMILRQNGVLVAASEPRADGLALAG
ncbi:MAG: gamma-glutamyltransferase family protein [Drouetiella hepatica Uher 2000/2452]|jgi:gamma-glutamyltranspeptidase/glutathione hydrolase|uniref:Gamma-glutamyltransferase family protein n=1 Tax=Drouetiella hepatica Uher 2000/2452 TaxID=904376 RepID=A0A951Q8V5_9CYAN|nr:gamma-glutamyltransferase family protein [Drouetiella hepatica Uher 2000/2452]